MTVVVIQFMNHCFAQLLFIIPLPQVVQKQIGFNLQSYLADDGNSIMNYFLQNSEKNVLM